MKTYGFDNIYNPECDLKVAFLGGSITEGTAASSIDKRYSTQTMEYFTALKAAQGRCATQINGGIGGTPSSLGMYRFASKMLPEKPDVVFVEFAVNDALNYENVGMYMEGIVRSCQRSEHIPVVIFLYSTLGKTGNYESLQKCIHAMNKVADHYGIAHIDFHNHLLPLIEEGVYVWDKDHPDTLTTDNVHPNDKGHTLYADFIKKNLAENTDGILKKFQEKSHPVCNYEFVNPRLVPHSHPSVKYSEGFKSVDADTADAWTPRHFMKDERRFSDGVHEVEFTSEAPERVDFDFKGRSVGLFYTRNYNTPTDIPYTIYDKNGNVERTGVFNMHRAMGHMACGVTVAEGLKDAEHKLVFTTPPVDTIEVKGKEYTRNRMSIAYFMIDGEPLIL